MPDCVQGRAALTRGPCLRCRDRRGDAGRPRRSSLTRNCPRRVEHYRLCLSGSILVMAHKPGPGRPSKGARDQFSVRPAVEVGLVLRQRAFEAGMFPAEYAAALLCESLGMSEYAPAPSLIDPDQRELPLDKTA